MALPPVRRCEPEYSVFTRAAFSRHRSSSMKMTIATRACGSTVSVSVQGHLSCGRSRYAGGQVLHKTRPSDSTAHPNARKPAEWAGFIVLKLCSTPNDAASEQPRCHVKNRVFCFGIWSGREDLNLRPLGPEPSINAPISECFRRSLDSGNNWGAILEHPVTRIRRTRPPMFVRRAPFDRRECSRRFVRMRPTRPPGFPAARTQ